MLTRLVHISIDAMVVCEHHKHISALIIHAVLLIITVMQSILHPIASFLCPLRPALHARIP